MRKCQCCGIVIPPERLEVLPDTQECVDCSTAEKPQGLMITTMSKGCGAELMILPNDPEVLRQAKRFNRRHR